MHQFVAVVVVVVVEWGGGTWSQWSIWLWPKHYFQTFFHIFFLFIIRNKMVLHDKKNNNDLL